MEVNISSLPHLFISYCEKEQLAVFLQHAIANLTNHDIRFAMAASSQLYRQLQVPAQHIDHLYLKEIAGENVSSRYVFIKSLMKELKRRKKTAAQQKTSFAPLLVIVEDILDLIISEKKFTGIYLLQLLVEGPSVNIHFIASSVRTYAHLLRQLSGAASHPKFAHLFPQEKLPQQLAAELIINPEDLYFFKTGSEPVYRRLFEMDEGVKSTAVLNSIC